MSGVYQIYNTETNKRYIGSSIDVQRRLKEHLRNLKANRLGIDIENIWYLNLWNIVNQINV